MRKHPFAGRLIIVSLIVSLAVIGAAAPGRELTDVTLMGTLGVDGPGPVALTAVGEGEGGEICRYTTQGPDLARTREALRELGDTRLEVTHVAQLVLGPDVDVEEILTRELTNRKSGSDATVWLVADESAETLLTLAKDPCKRLKALEENGSIQAPTLLEALSTLEREGEVSLPVLRRDGQELQVAGVEIIKEG